MTALLSADAVVAGYPGRADVLHGATGALHPGTRTAVLGANDGIVSVAGLVVGFSGVALLTAGSVSFRSTHDPATATTVSVNAVELRLVYDQPVSMRNSSTVFAAASHLTAYPDPTEFEYRHDH